MLPEAARHAAAQQEQQAAAERDIQFVVSHAEGTPEIKGDPPLIQKAVYQLMVNAIKYTPDGGRIGITLTSVALGDDATLNAFRTIFILYVATSLLGTLIATRVEPWPASDDDSVVTSPR